VSFGLSAEFNN